MDNTNVTPIGSPKTKTIIRIIKNRDFLQVSHIPLYDPKLSLKAKGILCIMLSMSDEWEFRREHLLSFCSDGKDSLKVALKELQDAGYVTLNNERDEKGRIQKWIMSVYEVPTTHETVDNLPTNPELSTGGSSRSGNSASGQPPIESMPVARLSRSGFTTSGESACNNTNNKNNINNNNNKAVAEKIKNEISDLQIPAEVVEAWLTTYSEPYVREKIALMNNKGQLKNPRGFLLRAIEQNYQGNVESRPLFAPASHETWSEGLQHKRDKEREVLADPNDWRDVALKAHMEKLKNETT